MKKSIAILVMAICLLVSLAENALANSGYLYGSVCACGTCGSKLLVGDYERRFDDPSKNYWVDSESLFAQCNCTSYVAWRLNEDWSDMNIEDPPFRNNYLGQSWGDAGNWKNAAQRAGIVVDNYPMPGDVAWWNYGAGKMSNGHVAYVERVYADGTVDISEYNFGCTCGYGTRTRIMADAYLHITYCHSECYETGLCSGFDNSGTGTGGGVGGGTSPSSSTTKPDFYVVSVKIADDRDGDHPKEAYFPNEKFYVIVTVANAGIEPTKDVVVGCYLYQGDDREKVGEEDIKHEHLPKGGTHTERFELRDIDPGTYQVKVRPDNEKEISESNEDNNWSTSVTLVIREWPNFTVEGIVFDEGTVFTPGAAVSVRGKFLNKGGDTKDGIGVACYLISGGNSTLVATQTIKDYHLEENECHWEGMSFALPNAPGDYSLKVVADPGNLVRESSEGDNSMTIPLTVVALTTTTTTTTTTSTTTTSTTTTSTTTVATTTTIAGTTTSTTTLPPSPVILYTEDFEEDAGGFELRDDTSSLDSTLEFAGGKMVIMNRNPPDDISSVRVEVGGLDFRGSQRCRLSLSLSSSAAGNNFGISFFNSASNDALFYNISKILPGQGKYSWTFLVNGQDVDLADIHLSLDVGEVAEAYYFDDILIERLEANVPALSPDMEPASWQDVHRGEGGEGKEESGGGGCFIHALSD